MPRRCPSCAQRLSASQRCSLAGADELLDQRPVLNAFRHHSGAHPAIWRLRTTGTPGAQRLSASQRCSRDFLFVLHEAVVCSTPFGITAVLTGRFWPTMRRVRSAQRLSASQRCSPLPDRHRFQQSGSAQRLSASQRCSLDRMDVSSRHASVLNAFRHHSGAHTLLFGGTVLDSKMCSTPFGITAVLTRLHHRTRR